MEGVIEWIVDNKEWLFSGVGVVAVGWIARVLFKKLQVAPSQTIRSGDGSTNVQAGRDVNIGTTKTRGDGDKR